MGLGADLTGDLEQLLALRSLRRKALFRMIGATSQCWRAEVELEQMYWGMRCLLLPSASVGLSLVLDLLNLEPGREVLIAPFGWLSNWSCLCRAGLVPRFLPLDRSLQLRAGEVAERITERTTAVIVTHLMGRGQQAVGEIARICADRGVLLLEDIAQSLGVSVAGKRIGTFGTAAWCSLNHHKLLSTGDGGFVLIRDAELFSRVSARHDQGCIIRDGQRRPAADLQPGSSLRVPELTGAILRAQLARFHLLRTRILASHRAVAGCCESTLGLRLISPHVGDLPFTVLFERPAGMRYPSLAQSGWHVATNVGWLAELSEHALRTDAPFSQTQQTLEATGAIGAGFIDPYYAVPTGLRITDGLDALPALVAALESAL